MAMTSTALDSNIFIYWLERNPDFFRKSAEIVKRIHSGEPGYCSTLVYAEIFRGNSTSFEALASIQNLVFIPMDTRIAQLAGQLRHEHKIKAPDAIHVATAITAGAKRFITNDKELTRLRVPGLSIEPLG